VADYRSLTWDDFYAARFPEGGDDLGGTVHALIALRKMFHQDGAGVLGSYMKWGLPVVKDLVAFAFFAECVQAIKNTEKAMHVVRQPLDRVDWAFVESIVSDGAEKYKAHMRDVEKDAHRLKPWLDGLEYALAGRLPGVEKPGDLFAAIMKSPEAS
jgi:hypothetical protein